MELEQLLRLEASRRNIDQIINMVIEHKELFDQLWSIYLQNKNPESRRAAWAIDLLNEMGLFINSNHVREIVAFLPKLKHLGMKRHSLRILECKEISIDDIGTVADICFKWLEAPESSVAVKMYSMKILAKISEKEPLISRELIDIIELQMNDATPGLKNIGAKTIRQLQKRISVLS